MEFEIEPSSSLSSFLSPSCAERRACVKVPQRGRPASRNSLQRVSVGFKTVDQCERGSINRYFSPYPLGKFVLGALCDVDLLGM